MRVVLREAAHAEQAVQRAGELVAVHKAQLAHAQRQIAVGVRLDLYTSMPPGQFIGLMAKSSPSMTVVYMFCL